jgi:hypothetical protein
MLVKMTIKVYEGTTKEGKKFNYFKAVQKNGTLIDVRFTRDVNPLPKKDCIIYVNGENVNLAKNRVYPCIWVKGIYYIENINDNEREKKIDKSVLDSFDVVDNDDVNAQLQLQF